MKFNNGYKHITVKLLYADSDLAKHAYEFGREGESIHYELPERYDENEYECKRFIGNLINGKTFPKYCLEGHRISFNVKGISRICLSQLTRDNAIFCSGTQGTKVLSQEYNIPMNIYADKEIMRNIKKAQKYLETAYQLCCEKNIPYPESRYILIGSHTINCNCSFTLSAFVRACYSRTNNSFCDELNYVYRKMFHELDVFIHQLNDQNSRKLWQHFVNEKNCINDEPYTRASIFNNDFMPKHNTFNNYTVETPAQNDWRKSCWKMELERIYDEEAYLLTSREIEEIEYWKRIPDKELPTTFDEESCWSPANMIKQANYKEHKK